MACIDENFLPRIFFSRIFITMNFSQTTVYKAEKPSVRLSDRHAGISAVSAWIEAGLARNGS